MTAHRTSTPTLIVEMRELASDVDSLDGRANEIVQEAANRLDGMFNLLVSVSYCYDELPCWLQSDIDEAIK
jgi:hypothetical protein